jgi:hypothetical protein
MLRFSEAPAMTPVLPVLGGPVGTAALGLAIILGLISLFFGRQLFYLFIALVGFVAGLELSRLLLLSAPAGQNQLFQAHAGWVQLLVGVVVGVLVALLAVLIQRPVAAVTAFFIFFLAGRQLFSTAQPTAALVGSVLLGIVGLVLVWIFFDWGLIASSALVGAATVMLAVRTLTVLPAPVALLLFLALAIVGALFQARSLHSTSV